MSSKTCYLSGPMSGLPDFNFPAFNDCAAKLRADGWHVFNPAENFEGRTDRARNVYMTADFKHLLSVADDPGVEVRGIVMLPGWSGSQGARVEVAMALEMGLTPYFWQGVRPHQTTVESVKVFLGGGGGMAPSAGGEVRVTDPKTGVQKGQKDARFDLIPTEPLRYLALVYGMGAKKYADDNWRKGYDWKLSYGAMQRHLNAFWGGEDMDPESHLPHLAHAMWHCATLLWFSENYTDGDTRAIPGR